VRASPRRHIVILKAQRERAVRAGTERLFVQLPARTPVPSLNFDEAREAARSSLASHQAVRHAAD
jgi:hypothetical protein